MVHFIELTQIIENAFNDNIENCIISVQVEHIDFYRDQRIVFYNRSISVLESYNEIKKKIEESMKL